MTKVLIAEDNILIAEMLEMFLTSEGFDVCGVASNVNEAVALVELHQPDLGIFDFRLAGGECGSEIRPRVRGPNDMKILYVSGDPLDTKLTRSDGEAYIQKPYGMKDLSNALSIIQEMKTNTNISPSVFPKSLHFLKNAQYARKNSNWKAL
jgi:DNA-binding response OmpR family regulator